MCSSDLGLRLLAPHLTAENQETVLAEAAGKSKRQIEELVARLWPQPPVPTIVRKLPDRSAPPPEASCGFSLGAAVPTAQAELAPAPAFAAPPSAPPRRDERPSKVSPLSEDAFKFQFTASRACHEKLRQAQDLLRHRVPNGDVATIFEKALDVLIDQVKKERFATGRKARPARPEEVPESSSRHIPDAIKREVFERDGGRCTFTDGEGRKCSETGGLEFDHIDGFARTRRPPSRSDPPALPSPQSTRRREDVRSAVHEASSRIGGPACAGGGDFVRVSARVIRPRTGRAALGRAPGDRSQIGSKATAP